MRNYEIIFIVDPTLSSDEVKTAADMYITQLKNEGCEIVHVDEWGLKQLAYPINKRQNGFFYVIEVANENGDCIDKLEIAFRRDERVMRFLCMRLDKFGVKYNADKRAGLIVNRKKERQAARVAAAAALADSLLVDEEAAEA